MNVRPLFLPCLALISYLLPVGIPAAVATPPVVAAPTKVISGGSRPITVSVGTRKIELRTRQTGSNNDEIAIRVVQGEFKRLNIFELNNPPRVVVDLYGQTSPKRFMIDGLGLPTVQSVRMASHKDRFRIVADLEPRKKPTLTWSVGRDLVSLNFQPGPKTMLQPTLPTAAEVMPGAITTESSDANATDSDVIPRIRDVLRTLSKAETVKPSLPAVQLVNARWLEEHTEKRTETPPVAQMEGLEQKEVRASLSPEVIEPMTVTPIRASTETMQRIQPPGRSTHVASSEVRPLLSEPGNQQTTPFSRLLPGKIVPPKKVGQELIGIGFVRVGEKKIPSLKLSLQERPQYTLLRAGKRLFRIKMDEASITSSHLQLPYFPPSDFTGFQMVKPVSEDKGIHVEIAVDEGYTIRSFTRDASIIVQAKQE